MYMINNKNNTFNESGKVCSYVTNTESTNVVVMINSLDIR